MGNSLGGKKTTKVMKIDGQTMKFKTPVYAGEIVKNYPGHVLLDSEAVKHFGVRAKALEAQQELRSKRLYFLVELPKVAEERAAPVRRVRSGSIQMSAKDRLESLMLARRSASDLSLMKPASIPLDRTPPPPAAENGGGVRVKLRLPKAEVEKLMMQSKDEGEAAEKLMQLCIANNGNAAAAAGGGGGFATKTDQIHPQPRCDQGIIKKSSKSREKRVGFLPVSEAEIRHLAVAS
ncbi:PREDICTED: uncharacterized protein At1g66480-like [Ipomoea nil]|uniref:uncharacterized protein At1g66480-like n=1 Tax=Ipomoea nil TaxID=35883 RepID=UPI000901DBF0|nr:PREDICTED: uncharacterized protein At1g66480-like [Ipomoea nil]